MTETDANAAKRWLSRASWWNELTKKFPIFVWRLPAIVSAFCSWRAERLIKDARAQ